MWKFLGLDVSLASTGVAIIEVIDRKPKLKVATRVKTRAKESHGERLYTIATHMRGLLNNEGPFTAIVREKGFSRFASSTQAIFKAIGVTDLIYRDYQIAEVSPTTVKKLVGGSGKASKQDVEAGVRRLLDLPDDFRFESDDASDACGVVLAYLIERGVINT